jgi:pimeloyl-ACP methyl ester carboxylesterase
LLPEIDDLGHQAIAMDLPGHGTRVRETSTIRGYREAVVERLEPGDILVGHSMGAAVATLAADAFHDLAHIVYLAGTAPRDGSSLAAESMSEYADGLSELDEGEESFVEYMKFTAAGDAFYFDLEGATRCLYNDCSPELAAWAHERMTPQSLAVANEPLPLPNFWHLGIPRSYISCLRDRACPPRISSLHAERLGCRTWELDTSHSPFLSRPRELAELLIEVAERL